MFDNPLRYTDPTGHDASGVVNAAKAVGSFLWDFGATELKSQGGVEGIINGQSVSGRGIEAVQFAVGTASTFYARSKQDSVGYAVLSLAGDLTGAVSLYNAVEGRDYDTGDQLSAGQRAGYLVAAAYQIGSFFYNPEGGGKGGAGIGEGVGAKVFEESGGRSGATLAEAKPSEFARPSVGEPSFEPPVADSPIDLDAAPDTIRDLNEPTFDDNSPTSVEPGDSARLKIADDIASSLKEGAKQFKAFELSEYFEGRTVEPFTPDRIYVDITRDTFTPTYLDKEFYFTDAEGSRGVFTDEGTTNYQEPQDKLRYERVERHEASHQGFAGDFEYILEKERARATGVISPRLAELILLDEGIAYGREGVDRPFARALISMEPEERAALDKNGTYYDLTKEPASSLLVQNTLEALEAQYRNILPTKPIPSAGGGAGAPETGVIATSGPSTSASLDAASVAPVLAQALSLWKTALGRASLPQVSIVFAALPNGELAETRIDALNAHGAPSAGTITIDPTAAGVGWFVDATPAGNSEFDTAYTATAMHAGGSSPAAGKYDLLTVLTHEIGHLLGFNSSAPAYSAHVGVVAGSELFVASGVSAELASPTDTNHLDATVYPNDLMNPTLSPSTRRLPTALDAAIVEAVRAAANTSVGAVTAPAAANVARLFGLSPSAWTTRGDVQVGTTSVTLAESASQLAGATQTFTLPAGTQTLTFTIQAPNFVTNGYGNPDDAFEMALINLSTGLPAGGAAVGLANTDAFLNVQGSGAIFYGAGVTVSGRTASGQTGALSQTITITKDVSALPAGTQLTLYLDLLGFGPSQSSLTVDVGGVAANTAPVATDIAIQVYANDPAKTISARYTDPDVGDAHSVSLNTTGTLGVVTNNGDGTFSYAPGVAFQHLALGSKAFDGFDYTVTDAAGASSTAHVSVTVLGESAVITNRPPVASDIAIQVYAGDFAKTIFARYTDPDASDAHSFSIDTTGTVGAVVDNGDGSFSYSPGAAFQNLAAGAKAVDGFDYTVTDAAGASSTAHVTVTVVGESPAAANRPPVASDIAIQVHADDSFKTILARFTDPDPSDAHTFSIGTTGTLGIVVDNGDGAFSYKPGSAFLHLAVGAKASDGFNYTVTDAAGASSTAHVTITIVGENIVAGNRPPVASDIAIKVHEGDAAKTIVARYTDPDVGDAHTISIDTRGTLEIVVDNGDGTFSYTAGAAFEHLAAGAKASDEFNYTVTDAAGASSTAHVLVTVLGVSPGATNWPPVASDIAIQVQVGDPAKTISARYTDPDLGDKHSFSVDTTGTHGIVVDNGDGTFSYTAGSAYQTLPTGAKASDGFNYTVTDAAGASSTAHVTITVLGEIPVPVDQPPVASDISVQVHANDAAKTIVANYVDPDVGDTHTFSIDTTGTLGIVVINGDGTFSYSAGAAFRLLASGAKARDGFTYTVTDSAGLSSSARVTIVVAGVAQGSTGTSGSPGTPNQPGSGASGQGATPPTQPTGT